ncbi:DUF4271 domain-containing protein [Ekhidna sp. To15]|uniref:DUF4271 domain-containing protein n=1 Tax=Ekhidna sp. To15 TaxID=3395267 RepID=UPI003F528C11
MRQLTFIIGFCCFLGAVGQQDTIVVTDYTKIMVGTDQKGEVFPVTSLDEIKQAGFFINGVPNGIMRICSSEDLFIWINGKLIDVIDDCNFYAPQTFFQFAESDTIYVSFSTKNSLAELKCELVIFEDLLVIRDQVSHPREVRDTFNEFVIIALLLLLSFLGVIVSTFPSRVSYLVEKSFTLKASAYEFVNTSFFTGASIYVLIFYSLALAFTGVYLDSLLSYGLFEKPESLTGFFISWIQIASIIFLLFHLKWLVISVVAGLFRFRDLKNYQLFDFLNFNLVLLIPFLLFLVLDFILNDSSQSWITQGYMILFPIMLILFVLWFTLKFVNNSPRKKLSIISYLCATEIIPVIILLGWFFK